MLSRLQTLFPTPRYLQMPAVGIDISDSTIRVLELVKGKDGLEVGRFGSRPIPPGVVVRGDIARPNDLIKVLIDLRKAFAVKFVRVSLPEEKGYLFKASAAQGSVLAGIESQLEENVPIPPADAVYDFDIVETDRSGLAHTVVSVLPKGAAKQYNDLFLAAGLTPLSFEIEAQAIARAIIPRGDTGVYMIVDFGGNLTGLSIVKRGVVHFTSTLDISGALLTASIQKRFNLSTEEAEKLKADRGFVLERGGDSEVYNAMVSTVAALRDEINKHYIYWHTKDEKEPPINKIVLCGGDSNLKGLTDYLSVSMRAVVEVGNPWVNVCSFDHYIPPITASNSLRYATAIGLAIRAHI